MLDAFGSAANGLPPGDPEMMQVAGRFRQSHKLAAVIVSPKGGQAMIDNTLLKLNQELDGFRLIAVRPGVATFEGRGIRVGIAHGCRRPLTAAGRWRPRGSLWPRRDVTRI